MFRSEAHAVAFDEAFTRLGLVTFPPGEQGWGRVRARCRELGARLDCFESSAVECWIALEAFARGELFPGWHIGERAIERVEVGGAQNWDGSPGNVHTAVLVPVLRDCPPGAKPPHSTAWKHYGGGFRRLRPSRLKRWLWEG